jgi:hypothetical protein
MNKLVIAISFALFAIVAGHAGPMPLERAKLGPEIILVGDRERQPSEARSSAEPLA